MKSVAMASENFRTGNLGHKKLARFLIANFAAKSNIPLSHVRWRIRKWQRPYLENMRIWITIKVHTITANFHFIVIKLDCLHYEKTMVMLSCGLIGLK